MDGRRWGPFSGGHLVAMFGFLVLAIALPGSLWAVDAFQNVAIENPTTGVKAAVDRSRRLVVSDPINDQSLVPSNFFHQGVLGTTASFGCRAVGTVPPGKALVARQVRLNISADPSPGAANDVQVFDDPTCFRFLADVSPPTIGQVVIPLDPGAVTTSGLSIKVGGSIVAEAEVDGYLVSAGQVTSTVGP
jgi:hypothetical protein